MPKIDRNISENENKQLHEISPSKQLQVFRKALQEENYHLHQHEDHFHIHEHYHGGEENIIVTLIGLVIHSVADGTALGASLFCKFFRFILFHSEQLIFASGFPGNNHFLGDVDAQGSSGCRIRHFPEA